MFEEIAALRQHSRNPFASHMPDIRPRKASFPDLFHAVG
jgi:hypothetical protein